jgi:MFS superfamily sulfate permease-like transporter
VVATRNLAIGVVIGSLTGLVIFARRVAHLANVTACLDPDGKQVVYARHRRAVLRLQQQPGLPVRLCR